MKLPKGWMKKTVNIRQDVWANSLLPNQVPQAIKFLEDMGYVNQKVIPDWLVYFAHRMVALGWCKTGRKNVH